MKKEWKWIALLLFATAIWGSTFALVKDLLSVMDAFAVLSLRFSLATLVFGAWFFAAGRKITPKETKQGAALGAVLFIIFASQIIGQKYTTATNSAFVTGLFVVFTPFVSALASRKAPGMRIVLAAVIAAAGLWLLTNAAATFGLGEGLTLITALFLPVQFLLTEKFLRTSSAESLVLVQIGFVAAVSSAIMLAGGSVPAQIAAQDAASIAFLAIFATVICYIIQVSAQKRIGPARLAFILTGEPIFAALFAYLFLGEILALSQLFGAALILAAMLLAEAKAPALPE